MFDFSAFRERLSERAQKVISYAIEEAQKRNHYYVGVEHLFLAVSLVETKLFDSVFESVGVDPHIIRSSINEYLNVPRQYLGHGLKITTDVKTLFQMAYERARDSGRYLITSVDLFLSMFQNIRWMPAKIVRDYGIEPREIMNGIIFHAKKRDLFEKELKKKFELPPALRQFGTNFNELAYLDKLPPLIGREKEMEELVTALCHRERSNSAMIVGESGVGKTALVEGLARKIEFEPESLPPRLRNKQIINIQMNTVVAGTMFRGMFEDRMEKIMRELKESSQYILFVDEAHTIIGAGSALGVPTDAADILKSSLAKGEIQIIGATTYEEYKMYIAEDEALARRFRIVYVEEPSIEETRKILYGLKPTFESTYNIVISEEAIETAMDLSMRYCRYLRLPDKVIRWIDSACVITEMYHPERPVGADDIYKVVSKEGKVPLIMVKRTLVERFKEFEKVVSRRIVGQKHVIERVGKKLNMNKGPLKEDYRRPEGVFLFLGPTGVGKTEMAKAIAEFLYGSEDKMIRIDMSEYTDGSVAVDKLIGMPRGIVGSERGGVLTSRIRENPSTVVLLDEVEKGHPLVFNLFLQVFDEGFMTDGKGRRVYFSDSTIIMTSNIGSSEFEKILRPPGFLTSDEERNVREVTRYIKKRTEEFFSPEFLNRIDDVLVFAPLRRDEVEEITRRYLEQIKVQVENQNKTLRFTADAVRKLAELGYSQRYGARFLKRVVDEYVRVPVTEMWNEGDSFSVVCERGEVKVKLEKRVKSSI